MKVQACYLRSPPRGLAAAGRFPRAPIGGDHDAKPDCHSCCLHFDPGFRRSQRKAIRVMIGSYINVAPKKEHLADDYSQCLLSPSAPPVIDSRTYGVTTNPKSIETHRRFVLSCMGAKGCVLVPPPAKPSRCQGVKPCALALTHVPRQKYLNCEQSCTYGWRRIAFNAALRRDAPGVRPDPGAPSPHSPHSPQARGPPCVIF